MSLALAGCAAGSDAPGERQHAEVADAPVATYAHDSVIVRFLARPRAKKAGARFASLRTLGTVEDHDSDRPVKAGVER